MTQTEHARATLARQIEHLDAQLSLAIADPAEDPVHDFRVAIRRLAQSLRVFAHLLPGKQARAMRRSLKPALDAAAVVRDIDVDSELLLKLGLAADHPLLATMRAGRARGAFAFTGHLYLLRAEDLPLAWLAALDSLADSPLPAADAPRATLPAAALAFFKSGRKAALKAGSPERLHAFRLEAKRFRYTLELFRGFYGPAYEQRLEAVREIQSLLGRRQDCEVTAALLRPLAAVDEAARTALATVDARAARLEQEFASLWLERFDAAGQQLLWTRYLSRRQPAPRTPAHATIPTPLRRGRQRPPEGRGRPRRH